jgi:hypothetical protein
MAPKRRRKVTEDKVRRAQRSRASVINNSPPSFEGPMQWEVLPTPNVRKILNPRSTLNRIKELTEEK